MNAIHWRIKVTYNWKKKKVNKKVNLGGCRQMPANQRPLTRLDIAILKDGCFEQPIQKCASKTLCPQLYSCPYKMPKLERGTSDEYP